MTERRCFFSQLSFSWSLPETVRHCTTLSISKTEFPPCPILVPSSTSCAAHNQKDLFQSTRHCYFLARFLQQAAGPRTIWFCLELSSSFFLALHSNSYVQPHTKISCFSGQCSKKAHLQSFWSIRQISLLCTFFLTDLSSSLPQFLFTTVRTRHWWNLQVPYSTDVDENYHCSVRLLQLIFLICFCPSLFL